MKPAQAQTFATQLTHLARELNAFAAHIKTLRQPEAKPPRTLREVAAEYQVVIPTDAPPDALFSNKELSWLSDDTAITNNE